MSVSADKITMYKMELEFLINQKDHVHFRMAAKIAKINLEAEEAKERAMKEYEAESLMFQNIIDHKMEDIQALETISASE